MPDFLPIDLILRIAVYLFILGILWFFLRAIFRITMSVFRFGCLAILLLGLILLFMNFLR